MNRHTPWWRVFALVAIAGLVACKGSSSPKKSEVGTATITMKGGTGSTGAGGHSNWFEVLNEAGGDVKLLKTGIVNTVATVPTSMPYLGTNPVEITADTTLDVCTVDETHPLCLYVANGGEYDNESPHNANGVVTGLKVDAGVTLTIKGNDTASGLRTRANLYLSDGLIVLGTIKSAGQDSVATGDALSLNAVSQYWDYVGGLYIGADAKMIADGQANTSGAGGTAGFIEIWPDAFVNLGTLSAVGGAGSTDGGDGAEVALWNEEGYGVSTGTIRTDGGAGTTGSGGSAGYIEMESEYSYLYVKGTLSATGATGATGGGSGNYIKLYSSEGGDIIVDATLNTYGGNATEDGDGGGGGYIYVEAYGPARVAGIQDSHGGNGAGTGNGGAGGYAETDSYYKYSWGYGEYENDSESITFGATVDTSGGNGATGGQAGYFYLYSDANEYDTTPANAPPLQMVGFASLDASGGAGTTAGGAGGGSGDGYTSYIYAASSYDGNDNYIYGSVVNEIAIALDGGAATEGPGGAGGDFEMYTEADYAYPPYNQGVKNSGAISTSGGDGTSGGDAGEIWIYGHTYVENTADLTANGGAGTTGDGGSADSIELLAEGPVTTSAALTTNGGGSTSGAAQDGGYIGVAGSKICTVSGALSANGGSSTGAAGYGGEIQVQSQSDASVIRSATFSVAAGTGTGTPTLGTVWIDGMQTVGPAPAP